MEGALAPGESTYFSLESALSLSCQGPECKTTTPTSLTTSLSGGGQSGDAITVAEGTAVTDNATLSGENASTATGTVEYMVYSDSECKNLVASAGSASVSAGIVGSSEAQTLPAGTYYWQATYGGDTANGLSASMCGSEVETVSGVAGCTSAIGKARIKAGKSSATVRNRLYTSLTEPQTLTVNLRRRKHVVLTDLTSASCVVLANEDEFKGEGTATVDGEGGYSIRFALKVSAHQRFGIVVRIVRGKERLGFRGTAKVLAGEVIS